jgi:hypothetical protein
MKLRETRGPRVRAGSGMAGIPPMHFSQGHESVAVVLLGPRLLTSRVESDDHFTRRRLG